MRDPYRAMRGAATLGVTLALVLALAIAALATQRRHAGELRASASRFEARQSFEAAEAGLAWATGMLNAPATGYRERMLSVAADTGAITPLPLRAACTHVDDHWHCRRDDEAPLPRDAAATASFEVWFEAAAGPGTVRLVALGCRRLPCIADDTGRPAAARLDVTLGLVPALAHAPLAALTVRDDVEAGIASLGLHDGDPLSGGIAVQAGGVVHMPGARSSGAPGAPRAAIVERDATLQTTGTDRAFAALFGLDRALWYRQPVVATVTCAGRCNDRLAQALATHRLVHVDGDLELEGPDTFGSSDRPVIVVADGAVRLRGALVIHGLIHGAGITWNDSDAGGLVRGAVVSERGYAGNGAPDIVRDRATLVALKVAGSYARLPGTWRDFR